MDNDTAAAKKMAALPKSAYNMALEDAKAGRLHQARDKLVALQQIAPDFVPALVLLGKVHAQFGELETAIDCWQRALELEPDNAPAQAAIAKANAMLASGRRSKAMGYAWYTLMAIVILAVGAVIPRMVGYISRPAPAEIARKIRASFAASPTIGNADLQVTTNGSAVSVSGIVPTAAGLELAKQLVKQYQTDYCSVGVRDVRTDEPVTVAEVLTGSNENWLADLSIKETEGTVKLSGQVPTRQDRQWLVGLVRRMATSKEVEQQLSVMSPLEINAAAGDNLWKLAELFYGDGRYWTDLVEANPGLEENPELIVEGERLLVPLRRGMQPSPVAVEKRRP